MANITTLTLASLAILLLVAAGLYFFTDTGKEVSEWVAEKYFKAEAHAAEKALEKTGSEKAEGFLYVLTPTSLPFLFSTPAPSPLFFSLASERGGDSRGADCPFS